MSERGKKSPFWLSLHQGPIQECWSLVSTKTCSREPRPHSTRDKPGNIFKGDERRLKTIFFSSKYLDIVVESVVRNWAAEVDRILSCFDQNMCCSKILWQATRCSSCESACLYVEVAQVLPVRVVGDQPVVGDQLVVVRPEMLVPGQGSVSEWIFEMWYGW